MRLIDLSQEIYEGMPDYATTIRELEGLGFELCGLFPVASGTFPRLVELSTGQALRLETPLLPGFALSIDDFFAPV